MTRIVVVALLLAAAVSLRIQQPSFVSRDILKARDRWRSGEVAMARAIAEAALPRLRREVVSSPADPERHMALAEALALLGRGGEALSEARAALARDAAPAFPRATPDGCSLLETMAIVAMEAGANDEALDAIEVLLAGGARSGGARVLHVERFAPLRSDPRFQKLLALYGAGSGSLL